MKNLLQFANNQIFDLLERCSGIDFSSDDIMILPTSEESKNTNGVWSKKFYVTFLNRKLNSIAEVFVYDNQCIQIDVINDGQTVFQWPIGVANEKYISMLREPVAKVAFV